MFVVGQQRSARMQRADRDDQIRQRQHLASAIELPSQFLRYPPHPVIGRNVDENIEEDAQPRPQFRPRDSSQNFATHDVAADQCRLPESLLRDKVRVPALSR